MLSTEAIRSILLAPIVPVAGFFLYAWFGVVRATFKLYSATLPLSLNERKSLARGYIFTGVNRSSPSIADEMAQPYLPEIRQAWKRAAIAAGLIVVFFAYAFIIAQLTRTH